MGQEDRLEAGSNNKKSKHSSRSRSKTPSDRDRNSDRQKKAKAKLDAGLAPPVIKKRSKTTDDQQESTGSQLKSSSQQQSCNNNNSESMGIFDKTQWENTKWAKEADDFKQNKGTSPGTGGQQIVVANNVVPGEERQEIRTQGEQLLKRSNLILVLLGTEMLLTVVALCVWCTAAVNPTLPQILAITNMGLVFILVTIIIAVEVFRFHVKRLEDSPTVRYYIPYKWRFQLCSMNVVRIFMICADITIMALDNDFDTGSVIVLALQPFHIILNSIHLIIALRPKTKQ